MSSPLRLFLRSKFTSLICLFLLLVSCTKIATHHHTLTLENPKFEVLTYDVYNNQLDFNSLPTVQSFYLTYWGATPTVELKFSDKRLPIFYRGNETEKVVLTFNGQTKTLVFTIQGKPAEYSNHYIEQHKGKVTAQIPEVYELTNIVLALADKFHQTTFGAYSEGDYYRQMMKWFAPFKDHMLFEKINKIDYYSLVENGPAYVFDKDKIQKSEVYSGFREQDAVAEHIEQLESFAKVSGFRAFFQQQQPYYLSLTKQFLADTQPENIRKWLELQFPARYQSYKVFFSPLGAGRHSARMYENNNFKESVMFISGPNRYEQADDLASIREIKWSRSFFTEIDHAYVNPVSDNYLEDIKLALADLSPWYKGGGYNTPYATFNEYMTWSVFVLYALDTYSEEEYQFIKNYVAEFMVKKRGFYKFKEFSEELTRLYKNRREGQNAIDLYEPIISWIKKLSQSIKS